ncbi:MAG TPA: PRC-barrel domain-containing protein [Acidimicrobiales bacterium]
MRHTDFATITGSPVVDRDGERVGTATDVIYDDTDLRPRWVVVRYGSLRHRYTAVPFDRLYVTQDGEVATEPDKTAILQAPRVKGAPLSREEENELARYFQLAAG